MSPRGPFMSRRGPLLSSRGLLVSRAQRPLRETRRLDDRGTVTVMIVGFFLVIGFMVAAVVDASAAYLRHQQLAGLADGAALAAADGVQGEQVYTEGLGDTALVDPASARQYVSDYLATSGVTAQLPGLSWQVVPVGDEVAVRLSAPLDLPLDPPGWSDSATVVAEAAVVVQVR